MLNFTFYTARVYPSESWFYVKNHRSQLWKGTLFLHKPLLQTNSSTRLQTNLEIPGNRTILSKLQGCILKLAASNAKTLKRFLTNGRQQRNSLDFYWTLHCHSYLEMNYRIICQSWLRLKFHLVMHIVLSDAITDCIFFSCCYICVYFFSPISLSLR